MAALTLSDDLPLSGPIHAIRKLICICTCMYKA
jgi:hypothetical protein